MLERKSDHHQMLYLDHISLVADRRTFEGLGFRVTPTSGSPEHARIFLDQTRTAQPGSLSSTYELAEKAQIVLRATNGGVNGVVAVVVDRPGAEQLKLELEPLHD